MIAPDLAPAGPRPTEAARSERGETARDEAAAPGNGFEAAFSEADPPAPRRDERSAEPRPEAVAAVPVPVVPVPVVPAVPIATVPIATAPVATVPVPAAPPVVSTAAPPATVDGAASATALAPPDLASIEPDLAARMPAAAASVAASEAVAALGETTPAVAIVSTDPARPAPSQAPEPGAGRAAREAAPRQGAPAPPAPAPIAAMAAESVPAAAEAPTAEPEPAETAEPEPRRASTAPGAAPTAGTATLAEGRVATAPPLPFTRAEALPTDAASGDWRLGVDARAPAARHEAAPPPTAQAQAIAGQITLAIGTAGDRRIELRLDPPELGRVQIQLNPTDGGLQAVVLAERPETHDLLRRHAETLARDLKAAGYGDVSLDFAAGGQAPPRQSDDRVERLAEAATPTAAAGQAPAVAPARRTAAGGLDIRL